MVWVIDFNMKRIVYVFCLSLFLGCNSEKAWDCFKTSGKPVNKEIAVAEFDKILVWEGIELIVEQGIEHKVIIQAGENLLSKVNISVADKLLQLSQDLRCNFLRDYPDVSIIVTTPELKEIRSSTGYGIRSNGILKFDSLHLYSENTAGDYHTSGNFNLHLDVRELVVVANGNSAFYFEGNVKNANFGLYSGDCRIYAADLIADDIEFYHRSTGVMEVNPQLSLRGEIVSLGDVISKNRPPIVDVETLFRGRLIFDL